MTIINSEQHWYCKNLGDALFADPEVERIKALCLRYSNNPAITLYYRHESAGQLHCDVILYIPPKHRDFALLIEATLCQKPDDYGLALLV